MQAAIWTQTSLQLSETGHIAIVWKPASLLACQFQIIEGFPERLATHFLSQSRPNYLLLVQQTSTTRYGQALWLWGWHLPLVSRHLLKPHHYSGTSQLPLEELGQWVLFQVCVHVCFLWDFAKCRNNTVNNEEGIITGHHNWLHRLQFICVEKLRQIFTFCLISSERPRTVNMC